MNMMLEISARLLAAMLLGGIIGIEREYRAKYAGFRTHFLVALGSALFCIVSQYGFGADLKDSSRVAAQVVSGIGFLGAGTIIFHKNAVKGLTTAAGLWVTAAIGLACGTGMYAIAVIATALVLLGLEALSHLIPNFGAVSCQVTFTASSKESADKIIDEIKRDCIEMSVYEMHEKHTQQGLAIEVHIEFKVKHGNYVRHLLELMEESSDISVKNTDL